MKTQAVSRPKKLVEVVVVFLLKVIRFQFRALHFNKRVKGKMEV
jgi:hypothetical protein